MKQFDEWWEEHWTEIARSWDEFNTVLYEQEWAGCKKCTEKAFDEGHQQGFKEGFKEGYEKGYNDWMENDSGDYRVDDTEKWIHG